MPGSKYAPVLRARLVQETKIDLNWRLVEIGKLVGKISSLERKYI